MDESRSQTAEHQNTRTPEQYKDGMEEQYEGSERKRLSLFQGEELN